MTTSNSGEAATWFRRWKEWSAANRPPNRNKKRALEDLIDARTRNAYDSVLRKLTRQDQSLSNLRNRATGILTIAALITSFATGLGFFKSNSSNVPVFPNWARWTLLAILLFMILLHLVISLPVKRTFGANPDAVLVCQDIPPEGVVRKSLVKGLIESSKKNERWITACSVLYQVQAFCLVAEAIIIIVATLGA